MRILVLTVVLMPAAAGAQTVTNEGYARDLGSQVWKNPFGLCWRAGQSWTPELAIADCDPDLVPKPPAPKPAPVAATPPPQAAPTLAPAAPPVVAAPVAAPVVASAPLPRRTVSLTLGADASFDTGKADLKPEGRAKLDGVAAKLKEPGVQMDSMTVTGHTDSVGSPASNQRLSERRAEAVKGYLVAQGIEGSKIRTVGRGQTRPVADNKTSQSRARNRRVEVEITGARATQ
ncbi:MAG TPA: OmpA family protein [Burkholderiales bacterium]|nr:OmpA family protein [Burkholderiales bacterium]